MKSVSVRKRERAREVGSVLTDDADRGGAGGRGNLRRGKGRWDVQSFGKMTNEHYSNNFTSTSYD